MDLSSEQSRQRLRSFLERLVPPSVIERGIDLAESGAVLESACIGKRVSGVVLDSEPYTTSLLVEALSSIKVVCECGAKGLTLCAHGVALLWGADDLGFLSDDWGFASREALYRGASGTPRRIAETILTLGEPASVTSILPAPHVGVNLDLSGDRLGVQILFDDQIQEPSIFRDRPSRRELDNILIESLDELGVWDEEKTLWFVNDGAALTRIIGLLREFPKLNILNQKGSLQISEQLLDAELTLDWQKTGELEASMSWVRDAEILTRSEEIIGSGPYWVCIDKTLYRLSREGSQIAQLFPPDGTLSISKAQLGPVLESLEGLEEARLLKFKNPQYQPETAIVSPTPLLKFASRKEDSYYQDQIRVDATVEFSYPEPKASENLVYLPDHAKQEQFIALLAELGFEKELVSNSYVVKGDKALDLLCSDAPPLPPEWKIEGFDKVRRGLKFADLALNVNIASSRGDENQNYDCHVQLTQNNANVPISSLFKDRARLGDKWVQLDSGAFAKLPGGGLNTLSVTLGLLDPNYRLGNSLRLKLPSVAAASLALTNTEGVTLNGDAAFSELKERLKNFETVEEVTVGRNFKGKLRPYQIEGLHWLSFLYRTGFGGILADEMGLGKTIQTLAMLQVAKQEGDKGPSLIVVPTSLLRNWAYEAARFVPDLKVLILHGPERKLSFGKLQRYDLVITSYALLRLDRKVLERIKFNFVILDEAQYIKNGSATTTKAAKALKARHRLALTGTPTENRPLEFWSIMDFLMPGYLGSSDFFVNSFEKPILEKGAQIEEAKFLRARTAPFVLRRTKAEVEKDLPPKIESIIPVEMADSQRALYQEVLEELWPSVLEAMDKKGVRGASVSILAALLRLRQICNHPNSIDALKNLPGFESGKFEALKELLLEALAEGKKILLYSQFLEMLRIIKRFLEAENVPYLYLDGSSVNRQDIVDQFNSDPKIRLFCISLKAGGLGLNLTAADTVIIYDPWWNPAVENQAADRAHRIGQTKAVNVYRLVTEDSVESRIMDLKDRKSKIADALMSSTGLVPSKLTRKEIEALFLQLPPKGN